MNSLTAGRAKPDTRRLLLSRRDGLSEPERTAKSAVICERAATVIAQRCGAGTVIALYAHKGSEVETAALDARLRERGFRIAYPLVVDASRVLRFFEVAIDALAKTRWGLREPNADAVAIAIRDLAAFVVPGLAFDRAGGRVGWGKGHYDATLTAARADAECIGLAFECQVVESVPRESHDVALDTIITEVATHDVAGE